MHPESSFLTSDAYGDFPLLMVISLFNLEELFVGYLWLQFDVDSLGAVANYHRLPGTRSLQLSSR